jgi:transcriptional regulator with XRE-family HTH domain
MRKTSTGTRISAHSAEPFRCAMKRLMEERGLTYRQLAYLTGLSPGYLNHLTKGARPVPANRTLERIARALRVEPDHFREYRVRFVMAALSASPDLLSAVYLALDSRQSRTGPPPPPPE